jgi:hypothetical protein
MNSDLEVPPVKVKQYSEFQTQVYPQVEQDADTLPNKRNSKGKPKVPAPQDFGPFEHTNTDTYAAFIANFAMRIKANITSLPLRTMKWRKCQPTTSPWFTIADEAGYNAMQQQLSMSKIVSIYVKIQESSEAPVTKFVG